MTNDGTGTVGSFLLADCGSITTTVALFDLVEDEYRLIARAVSPTTIRMPWHDVVVGIQEAASQVSAITGRPLITESGELITPEQQNGAGVDFFGLTISAARPLKVIVAGLLEDVSIASVRRALESIYAQEVSAFTLDTSRDEQSQIQAVLNERPDLLFIAGGADGSDPQQLVDLLESLELGAGLLNGARGPDILYAGNRQLRERVTESFGQSATIYMADNVRPSIEAEQLHDAKTLLGEVYLERKLADIPGIQDLSSWIDAPMEATGRAFATMIDYFGALYRSPVIGVDLGSNNVVLASADDAEPGRLFIRSNLGMGEPLPEILNVCEPDDILHWAPVDLEASQLNDFIYDKAIHPQTVPLTEDEVFLEQAIARILLRQTLSQAARSWGWPTQGLSLPSLNLMVLRGSVLANSPRPGQALLTVLDALQPSGVFSVAVDRHGILPMLGLMALQDPAAVVQILEGGVLHELGWVIAPVGAGTLGDHALHIVVASEDKGEYHIDAEFGELIAVPLAQGASAELRLKPDKKVDVGRGPGRGRKITVHGGAVGLVVDVRGRPLTLPEEDEERRRRLRQWHWDMGS